MTHTIQTVRERYAEMWRKANPYPSAIAVRESEAFLADVLRIEAVVKAAQELLEDDTTVPLGEVRMSWSNLARALAALDPTEAPRCVVDGCDLGREPHDHDHLRGTTP